MKETIFRTKKGITSATRRTSLRTSAAIVGLIGVLLGIRTAAVTAGVLSTAGTEGELVGVGLSFTFFIEFLFVFVLWFFTGGTIHTTATFAFGSRGSFHEIFSRLGVGFVPLLVGCLALTIGTIVAIGTIDGTEIETIVEFQVALRTHPTVLLGVVIALGSVLVSGYQWTMLTVEQRDLSIRQAGCCTIIPTGMIMSTILYMWW